MNLKQVRLLLLLIFYAALVSPQLEAQSSQIRFCDYQGEGFVQQVWWVRYRTPDKTRPDQVQYVDDIYLHETFTLGSNGPLNYYRRIIIFYRLMDANSPDKPIPEQHLIHYKNPDSVTRLGKDFPKWREELGDYGCIPDLKNQIENGSGQMRLVPGNAPSEVEDVPTRYLLNPIYDGYLPLPMRDAEYKDADYVFEQGSGYRVFIDGLALRDDLNFNDAVADRELGPYQYQKLKEFYSTEMQGWTVDPNSNEDSQVRLLQNNKIIDLAFDINPTRKMLVIIVKGGEIVNGHVNFQGNQNPGNATQCSPVSDTFEVGTSHEVRIAPHLGDSLYCLSEIAGIEPVRSKEVDPTITSFLPAWLPGQP